MDSRRDFIKKAALLSGSAGISNILPSSVLKAMAIDPAPGSTYLDAEHIVILMQENRSFDHCFGSLQGVRGFNDPRALTLPSQNPVWLQTNAAGDTYAPFRLNIKDTKATWMNSLPHSWENQVDARNHGRYDQWLEAKRSGHPDYGKLPMTLGYYTRADIPFYYTLADAFTICDQHFCSSLTGTTPNRLYLWTGKIREDNQAMARVRNGQTDYEDNAAWTTFPERLEEQGISWKMYQNELSAGEIFSGEEDSWLANFTDNPLEWFSQYHVKLSAGYIAFLQEAPGRAEAAIRALEKEKAAVPPTDTKKITQLDQRLERAQQALNRYRAEQQIYTAEKYNLLSNREKQIHNKAFTTNSGDPYYHSLDSFTYTDNGETHTVQIPRGDVLHQFRKDVENGELPAVSWVIAPENFSDHPTAPWYGAWYVSEVMDILTKNPEVWKKTIFILTYDENDGCFDHIPPFVPPHPTKENTGLCSAGIDVAAEYVLEEQELRSFSKQDARESPIGLGYRVPMVIASPWSRGGWVCSEIFDHTSVLQLLEKFLAHKTGKTLREDNISQWRRTVCGDLTNAFRPYHGEKIPSLSFPERNAFIEDIHKAKFKAIPDNYKKLSVEEQQQIRSNPAASPYMPQQEKGTRPSCGLAYQLLVNGRLSDDKKHFRLSMEAAQQAFGKNALGAPFTVYTPLSYVPEPFQNRHYTVAAGDALQDSWAIHDFEDGRYQLEVYGPNGFYRRFGGDSQAPAIEVSCSYEKIAGEKLSGHLLITLLNKESKPLTVELVDNAYGAGTQQYKLGKAGSSEARKVVSIDLSRSHHWYDCSVRLPDNALYEQRFAGRVDTGKDGFTDPLMGGLIG